MSRSTESLSHVLRRVKERGEYAMFMEMANTLRLVNRRTYNELSQSLQKALDFLFKAVIPSPRCSSCDSTAEVRFRYFNKLEKSRSTLQPLYQCSSSVHHLPHVAATPLPTTSDSPCSSNLYSVPPPTHLLDYSTSTSSAATTTTTTSGGDLAVYSAAAVTPTQTLTMSEKPAKRGRKPKRPMIAPPDCSGYNVNASKSKMPKVLPLPEETDSTNGSQAIHNCFPLRPEDYVLLLKAHGGLLFLVQQALNNENSQVIPCRSPGRNSVVVTAVDCPAPDPAASSATVTYSSAVNDPQQQLMNSTGNTAYFPYPISYHPQQQQTQAFNEPCRFIPPNSASALVNSRISGGAAGSYNPNQYCFSPPPPPAWGGAAVAGTSNFTAAVPMNEFDRNFANTVIDPMSVRANLQKDVHGSRVLFPAAEAANHSIYNNHYGGGFYDSRYALGSLNGIGNLGYTHVGDAHLQYSFSNRTLNSGSNAVVATHDRKSTAGGNYNVVECRPSYDVHGQNYTNDYNSLATLLEDNDPDYDSNLISAATATSTYNHDRLATIMKELEGIIGDGRDYGDKYNDHHGSAAADVNVLADREGSTSASTTCTKELLLQDMELKELQQQRCETPTITATEQTARPAVDEQLPNDHLTINQGRSQYEWSSIVTGTEGIRWSNASMQTLNDDEWRGVATAAVSGSSAMRKNISGNHDGNDGNCRLHEQIQRHVSAEGGSMCIFATDFSTNIEGDFADDEMMGWDGGLLDDFWRGNGFPVPNTGGLDI